MVELFSDDECTAEISEYDTEEYRMDELPTYRMWFYDNGFFNIKKSVYASCNHATTVGRIRGKEKMERGQIVKEIKKLIHAAEYVDKSYIEIDTNLLHAILYLLEEGCNENKKEMFPCPVCGYKLGYCDDDNLMGVKRCPNCGALMEVRNSRISYEMRNCRNLRGYI